MTKRRIASAPSLVPASHIPRLGDTPLARCSHGAVLPQPGTFERIDRAGAKGVQVRSAIGIETHSEPLAARPSFPESSRGLQGALVSQPRGS